MSDVYVIQVDRHNYANPGPAIVHEIFAGMEDAVVALTFWIAIYTNKGDPWVRQEVEGSLKRWANDLVEGRSKEKGWWHIAMQPYGLAGPAIEDYQFKLSIVTPTVARYPKFKEGS